MRFSWAFLQVSNGMRFFCLLLRPKDASSSEGFSIPRTPSILFFLPLDNFLNLC